MVKIINRYIFKELSISFSIGLLIFTFTLLMDKIRRLTELVINKGVPLSSILELILYILPSFFAVTIPMAVLLSVLVTFSRLSADNEITAIRASGMSLYGILAPVITLSLIGVILTTYIMISLLPLGNQAFKTLLFNIVRTRASVGIEAGVFNDTFEGLVIYVKEMSHSKELQEVFISDVRNPNEPYTIVAKKGAFISDQSNLRVVLKLWDGSIHSQSKDAVSYNRAQFNSYDLQLDIDKNLAGEIKVPKGSREMTLSELWEKIDGYKREGKNYYIWLVDFHKKFSIPFACLTFGIIGPPLGLLTKKSGRLGGFAISIGVILVYYIFISTGENLSSEGKIHPFFAMWTPNIIFIIIGLFLFDRASKSTGSRTMKMIYNYYDSIFSKFNKRFKRET